MKPEIKAFRFEMKDLNEDKGTFEGYSAVFGNVDEVSDVIEKGAFLRSINSRNGMFPLLFSHEYQKPAIGKAVLSEDNYGLLTKGIIFKDRMEVAKDIYFNMKEGVSNSMSFMYDVVKYETEKRGENTIRLLKELKIYEASILNTGFAANPMAGVISIKQKMDNEIEQRLIKLENEFVEIKNNKVGKEIVEALKELKALQASMTELAGNKSTSVDDEPATDVKSLQSVIESIKSDLHIFNS